MRALALPSGAVVLTQETVASLVEHLHRGPQPSSLTAPDLTELSRRPASSRDVLVLEKPQVMGSKLTTEQAGRVLGISPGAVRR